MFCTSIVDVNFDSLFVVEDDDVPGDEDAPGVVVQKGRMAGPISGGRWTVATECSSCAGRYTDPEPELDRELVCPHVPPSLPSGPVLLVVVLSLLPSHPQGSQTHLKMRNTDYSQLQTICDYTTGL